MPNLKFPKSRLIHFTPAGKAEYLLKNSGPNIIGRKSTLNPPDVDLLVKTPDGLMSRRHARIDVKFGQQGIVFLLTDLGSQNGTTLINRQRDELKLWPGDEVYLEDGFTIRMGATEVVFEVSADESLTQLKAPFT